MSIKKFKKHIFLSRNNQSKLYLNRKQIKGETDMKKVLIGSLVGVVVLILIAVISMSTIWSHRNTAVSLDEQIKAQHVANKSNYDNMWKSFKEAAQVSDKQAEQFKDVFAEVMKERNGNKDNLLMEAVQEQNPNMSTEVYTHLQNMIKSGRTEFDNNQKKIADIIREYNTFIRKCVIMNAIFRFDILDANDYIVTSEKTEKAFKTGKDDAIDLNSK